MRFAAIFIGCVLWTAFAHAGEQAPEEMRPWKAGAEAGVLLTRGNTDTDSVNAKLSVENDRERWRHRFSAGYLNASDQGTATAERTTATAKSEYKMSDLDYLFAVLRFESDRFSGYSFQSAESAGYGRRFVATARATLEMEAGVGVRQTHFVDESRKNEAIMRVALRTSRIVAAGTELSEEAFSEIAKENTHTESITSFKSRINGNLSIRFSVTAVNNTGVPEGRKKTDTTTALTLVFDY